MVKSFLRASLLYFIGVIPLHAATTLSASIDKNPAMYGEAITLTVQVDERVDAKALDVSALEQDFRLTGPSVSQSMQIVNGQASQSTTWQYSLFAKNTGKFTIPALQVAGAQSQAIQVEVVPATQSDGSGAELFLQNSFSVDSAYIQQLFYYDVKIFFKGDLQSGSLSQPEIAGAEVEQLGKDKDGSEIVNGERYQTITRRYTVIPQKAGDLQVTAPTFTGDMIARDTSRYDYFARTKRLSVEGQVQHLTVKAAPSAQQPWLPSELVTLTEEWTTDPSQLVQGEPATRIITLTALDLADYQLPDLSIGTVDGVKTYPEQPQTHKAERRGRQVVQKIFRQAVIAEKNGQITLPAVKIAWWNTKTDQAETAELAQVTLTVAPGNNQQGQISAPENQDPVTVSGQTPSNDTWQGNWQINYLTLVFATLWLATIGLWIASRQYTTRQRRQAPVSEPVSQLKFNPRKLQQACEQNDAELCKQQLLRFAEQLVSADIVTLHDLIAKLPDSPLRHQIQVLSYQGYQKSATPWQGQPLWQAWQQAQQQPTGSKAGLKPLYLS